MAVQAMNQAGVAFGVLGWAFVISALRHRPGLGLRARWRSAAIGRLGEGANVAVGHVAR